MNIISVIFNMIVFLIGRSLGSAVLSCLFRQPRNE